MVPVGRLVWPTRPTHLRDGTMAGTLDEPAQPLKAGDSGTLAVVAFTRAKAIDSWGSWGSGACMPIWR